MKLSAKLIMAVSVWLSISFSAYAQTNHQTYPGIGCKPNLMNAPEATLRATEVYIVNVSNMPVPVVCPIVIDPNVALNNTIVTVTVFGRVPSTASQLTCSAFGIKLVSADPPINFNSRIIDSDTETAEPTQPVVLQLEQNRSSFADALSWYYSLSCLLPTGGRIFSYQVLFQSQ
jgi:hypothetical protein